MTGIQSLTPHMLTQWQRHEILANNLANASTPGFKRDDIAAGPATPPIDLTAAGTRAMMQWTDFGQGPVHSTGRTLDVALNGSGFLVVDTPNGPRYSRGGALTITRDGTLTTADGHPVLGDRGPLVIGTGRIDIAPNGEITTDAGPVGTLRVVDFAKPYPLVKEGRGLFAAADASVNPAPATGYEVVGSALEGANVNVVETMVGMIEPLRSYEAAQKAIQSLDETNHEANDMGKV
jgi:flagellar basal-body rod protein FlgF